MKVRCGEMYALHETSAMHGRYVCISEAGACSARQAALSCKHLLIHCAMYDHWGSSCDTNNAFLQASSAMLCQARLLVMSHTRSLCLQAVRLGHADQVNEQLQNNLVSGSSSSDKQSIEPPMQSNVITALVIHLACASICGPAGPPLLSCCRTDTTLLCVLTSGPAQRGPGRHR
jgi:hypothetical protein